MIVIDRQHLRREFRLMRYRRKLSQKQLAAMLNVGKNTISYRESGRNHFDIDAVLKTAHVFGYDVALTPKRTVGARPTGTGWPA